MENKEAIPLVITGVIVGLILTYILANDGGKNEPVSPVPTPTPTEERMSSTSIDMRKTFVSACAVEDQAYCGCVYDFLEDNYTNQEIIDISNRVDETELPQELIDGAAACYEFIK